MKLDFDLQSEKVTRLEQELNDVTSSRQGDQEVMTLKRLKNELERRVQEQEEELDEQAGTIQQLEQVRLQQLEQVRVNSSSRYDYNSSSRYEYNSSSRYEYNSSSRYEYSSSSRYEYNS